MLLRYRRQESGRRKRTFRACRVRPGLYPDISLFVCDEARFFSELFTYWISMKTEADQLTWSEAGDPQHFFHVQNAFSVIDVLCAACSWKQQMKPCCKAPAAQTQCASHYAKWSWSTSFISHFWTSSFGPLRGCFVTPGDNFFLNVCLMLSSIETTCRGYLWHIEEDGNLNVYIYWKPTNTDQYLLPTWLPPPSGTQTWGNRDPATLEKHPL